MELVGNLYVTRRYSLSSELPNLLRTEKYKYLPTEFYLKGHG